MQSRKETPHKELPAPKDLLDEGTGLKAKAKAKDTPPKPPRACRYRDVNCLLKANPNGNKIGAHPPAAPSQSQVAAVSPKSAGNWFKRMGQKISGPLSGTSVSALLNPANNGNSFLPTATTTTPAAAPPPPSFASLNEAKLDPRYRIGTGGEDLFSGNYHWSTPLVSLPGRGGLDLNLSLHYNSLQWVRYGDTMYFDPDWYVTLPTGLTTGFNLGFPEIEAGYSYDGVYSYAVTLPSGYRVPLRRVMSGSNAKYEAVDGSYLYLTISSTGRILYLPDGTQYSYDAYSYVSGGYRCSQVRDSNGNRINIAYGTSGIDTITDTLGRVLTFSYDPTYGHLMQITQNWMGQPRIMAQFDYDWRTLSYNFGSLTVDAPANNSQVPVLTRVITNDRARQVFVYNDWGLVDDIFLYGASDEQRAAMDYVFPASTTALSDAPRFSERNDGIFGFSGQWNTNLGWVANYFLFDPNETWGKVQTPDGVVHVEQFSASGNTRGLATGMETWTGTSNWQGGVRRKWTTTNWISDSANKPLYPRVTETNIYDDADGNGTADNRRRATVSYTTFTKTTAQSSMPYTVHLPFQSTEYAADATSVYRYTETNYLDDTNYWTRWIIGLPLQQRLYDGAGTLQAQTGSGYDEATCLTHTSAVLQHDTANYGQYFYYRDNPTSTQRYSVANGTASSPTQTQATYYLTGNVATARDALNHETKFFYDDAFATYADDSNNTETPYNLTTKSWAYPTRVEDPDLNSSHLKYWYDTGAPTRTTDPKGAAAISIYETAYGHLTKSKNLVNNAYTRYDYDTGQTWVQVWSTINDMTESAVLSLLDGAGRERQRVDEHPGSSGTLSSSYRIYDLVGRVVEWSNPTEISSNTWLPVGDDAAYVYSRQEYDWNHRPTITYHQDYHASTNPNSKRTISYEGCGCAGGQVTTLTDEVGRLQKVYADFLGRSFKAELWNGSSVYSTNLTTFNVRDQVTQSSVITGTNGASQNIDTQYDGYGRLWKRKSPLQTTDTIYTYYNDDELQQVKDARLAAVNYFYNARGLVTDITYDQPPGNPAPTDPLYVAPVQPVHFTYDSAGNRETMTDGIGSFTYAYNTLSRMMSEERTITELNKSYSLTYDYNLAGQVKQVSFVSPSFPSDNVSTYYGFDKTGRVSNITGSPFAGVTQYTSQTNYRAFGVVKSLTYGNNLTTNATHSARLQLQSLNLKRPDGVALTNKTYHYQGDSRLKFADDQVDDQFDRAFQWDHAGRLQAGFTGSQARNFFNNVAIGTDIVPYHQANTYDVWGNRLSQTGKVWSNDVNQTETYDPQTLRHNGWTYDAAGHVINQGGNQLKYDAAGRNLSFGPGAPLATQSHDGDGLVARQDPVSSEPVFYINSTVLGGKMMAEINGMSPQSIWVIPRGGKLNSYVYAGETRIATQNIFPSDPPTQIILWHQIDPLTGTKTSLASNNGYSYLGGRIEPDLQGLDVGLADPANFPPPPPDPEIPDYFGGGGTGWNPNQPQYTYNGIRIDEQFAMELLSSPSGAAVLDPKYKHDSMTLSRAGISGHWEDRAGASKYIDTWNEIYNDFGTVESWYWGARLFQTTESHFVNVMQGDFIGLGLNQSKKRQRAGKTKKPIVPPPVAAPHPLGDNHFRCGDIQTILSREETVGTANAAQQSSVLWGDRKADNLKVRDESSGNWPTRYGQLDLEWFAVLNSPKTKLAAKLLTGGLGGFDLCTRQKIKNLLPQQGVTIRTQDQ